MLQYKWKPSKKPVDRPGSPVPVPTKKKVPPIRKEKHDASKKTLLHEMAWEHPTVNLDMGTLRANVHQSLPNKDAANLVVSCIKGAVREASKVKRRCQEVLGRYLEKMSSMPSGAIDEQDRAILHCICLPDKNDKDDKDISSDGGDSGVNDEDSPVDNDGTEAFVHSFMTFLYSGNLSSKTGGTGVVVNKFVRRLQDLSLLPRPDISDRLKLKNKMEYTPSSLVRSVAKQFATELKNHLKLGCKMLSEKVNYAHLEY